MPLRSVLIAVISVLAAPLATEPARGQTTAALAEQVRRAEAAFAATMAARDFASFGAYVADEAIFFGNASPLRGKAAVLEAWRSFFAGPTPMGQITHSDRALL